MTMKWDPEKMSTGLRVVDQEHQEWIIHHICEVDVNIWAGSKK